MITMNNMLIVISVSVIFIFGIFAGMYIESQKGVRNGICGQIRRNKRKQIHGRG